MSSADFSPLARIGKRSLYLASLALVLVLSGIGVLSIFINWRDVAELYFAHASSYKRYLDELEGEARKKNQAHSDRLAENQRLQAGNDSLMREMEKIERRIKENKLKFRQEVLLDIYGFKRDLSVQRVWEKGSTLNWRGTEIARVVLHNFWDIPADTNLPAAYMAFYHSGKPWYVREMLNRFHRNSVLSGAQGPDCLWLPASLDTTMNKYGVLITKLKYTFACEPGYQNRKSSEMFWIGTAADSSRWIIEIDPDGKNMRKLGLGPAYLEQVLDSLMFRQFHYN